MEIQEVIEQANLIRGYFNDKQMRVLYPIVQSLKEGSVVVEIGTFYGKSSRFFSLTNPKVKITTIDIGGLEDCLGIDPRVLEGGNVEEIRSSSKEQAIGFGRPIDFLFIDGSHEYEDVLQDLELWTPYLHEGSWLVCHDINFDGVKAALDEWKTSEWKKSPKGWSFQEIEYMLIARRGGDNHE